MFERFVWGRRVRRVVSARGALGGHPLAFLWPHRQSAEHDLL
jgi:hypothetical protein